MKIFLVDDEPDYVSLFKQYCEAKGILFAFSLGNEPVDSLVERIRNEQPDIVVLDVMMPSNGFQIAMCLTEGPTPIALSSCLNKDDYSSLLKTLRLEFIPKIAGVDAVVKNCYRIVEKKRSRV